MSIETKVIYPEMTHINADKADEFHLRTSAASADKKEFTVHAIGNGILMASLATAIAADEVESLAQGIVGRHKELAPEGDTTCIFGDSAFADDVAKTNLPAILEQNGIQNVRSL